MTNSFIHHVFFWLNNADSAEDKAALIAGLRTLTEIPGLLSWHIGEPANTDRPVIDRSYSISWLTVFDSPEAEQVYQSHPTHLKFIADCAHLWSRVVVYDSVKA